MIGVSRNLNQAPGLLPLPRSGGGLGMGLLHKQKRALVRLLPLSR